MEANCHELYDNEVLCSRSYRNFNPRPYQHELLEYCLNSNAILVLGTGSGKTLISIMLIEKLKDAIRGRLSNGAKRTIFIANTVPLVEQQAEAIQCHSSFPFKVGKLTGKNGFESWKEERRLKFLEETEILVIVPQIFKEMLVKRRITFDNINLLIIDECHHTTGDHPLSIIMQLYHDWKKSKVHNALPRILGMTACVVNRKCSAGDEVKTIVKNLESIMDCTLVTSKHQDIVQLYTTRPEEIIETFLDSDFSFNSLNIVKTKIDLVLNRSKNLLCIEDENYTIKHFYSKFKRLLQILETFASDNVRIIVFTDTRNRAKFLHSLLLSVITKYPCLKYLKPESVVGSSSKEDDLKLHGAAEKGVIILKKFVKGECNIIFSTNVLEEGIDIQSCNVVIRFDKPKFFSSYIQSLGRARASPSKFILLAEQNDFHNVANDIADFKEISQQLIEVCYAKCLSYTDHANSFSNNSQSNSSAYQILENYCHNLPQDKFSKLSPSIEFSDVEKGIQAFLQLPRNSPLNICISGDVKDDKNSAMDSAANLTCSKLLHIGELNEHGLPTTKQPDIKCNGTATNELQNGTSDRRGVYERGVCRHFKCAPKMNKLYLHCINFNLPSSFLDNKQRLGILCAEPIVCSKVCIYHDLEGKVEVDIQFVHEIGLKETKLLDQIKLFHEMTYQFLLNIDDIIISFNMVETKHAVLLVPLTYDGNVDTCFLEHVSKFCSFEDLTTAHNMKPFLFSADKYVDAVVKLKNNKTDYFFVDAILTSKNALSKYPESKGCESYLDYYMRDHQITIKNIDQPLLQCERFPKQLINHKFKQSCVVNVNNEEHLVFIPELCLVVPFKYSFLWQIYLVPSLLHRLNGLLLAEELFLSIDCFDILDAKKKILPLSLENIFIAEQGNNEDNKLSAYPRMILQSLTSVSACDDFNLERLELLGDSFLKFCMSVYLFCKEHDYHEGKLSMERANYVSNRTLSSIAKDKDIPKFFQGYALNENTIIPYGYQIKEDLEVTLRHLKVDPNQWLTYFQNIKKYDITPQDITYHPWKEQLISDKSIADCVESLIGVYLLIGGIEAAKHLLIWFGFEFLQQIHDPPKTAMLCSGTTHNDLNIIYTKLSLCELEKMVGYYFKDRSFLLEAVTHPSDILNKITGCYQRLEFLGDAVLDFLITKYIYSKFQDCDPGQLTDIRAHFVSNATLGLLAVKLGLHKYLLHNSPRLKGCIYYLIDLINQGKNEFNSEDDSIDVEDVHLPKALGDMFEAILGAIYIDSNQSLEVCWKVLKGILREEFIRTESSTPINNVRVFYETFAKLGCTPSFEYPLAVNGNFFCNITLDGYGWVSGKGPNKRIAKQAAAKEALALLST